MKLVGLMPVRNESWCLGLTLRAALMWCDEVIVYLHACDDSSKLIADEVGREHPGRVNTSQDISPSWREMQHRQSMLNDARLLAATHIAIIDADEILTGNMLRQFKCGSDIGPAGSILELPGYNLRNGIAEYHSNGVWGNRWFSTAFKDSTELNWSGDRFHHREPMGRKLTPYRPIQQGMGGTMHLWGANERRLRAKHAMYKVTERLRWPGKPVAEIDKMYSLAIHGDPKDAAYGTPATWEYKPVPDSWWAPYSHLMHHLHLDMEPWQEAETRRLIAEHGREKFAGLDLFGLD